eukprot:356061-Chlamydomonas_euryale.AAC.1
MCVRKSQPPPPGFVHTSMCGRKSTSGPLVARVPPRSAAPTSATHPSSALPCPRSTMPGNATRSMRGAVLPPPPPPRWPPSRPPLPSNCSTRDAAVAAVPPPAPPLPV